VVDGALPGTLLISNNLDHAFRLSGSANTYSGGTVVLDSGTAISNPLNSSYAVEVTPGSRLGTGDVLVQSNGLLRLLAGGSIHPPARLNVQGFAFIPGKIVVKVAELTLGGQTYTSGTFGQTNSDGHIVGGGTIAVNVTNSPPTVALINPGSNSTFTAGVTLALRVYGRDEDGFIARVDFLAGTNLVGSASAPPYAFYWTNLPVGIHTLTAVATDNGGAQTVSAPVMVEVTPLRLTAGLSGETLLLTFTAAANASYVVESSVDVTGPWQQHTFLRSAPTNRLIDISFPPTNGPQRFYRARTSSQRDQ
jgi:hypothetical protein